MSDLYQSVVTFFTQDDWPFTPIEQTTMLRTAYQGKNGAWTCFAQVREEQQQFLFYSICPERVPEDHRLILADFFTRANYGLAIGNFEMDVTDGEIRYKTSIDVEGDRLSTVLIKQLVYANVVVMDTYLPGIMAVMFANVSPAQAILQIEGH
ncbi:MAG: YbjN domain-containing protein [Chloroflexaceae bacterium]|nr:YbjN domain-containing protein [Chloroflexaceae bacterium]